MKIRDLPFTVTNWDALPSTEHRGETGTSFWRTFEAGDLRVRIVDYSSGYRADHWCGRGHVLLLLTGELLVKLKDGREFQLEPGMSFQAADDEANPHLGSSIKGARVFIVD
jgi:hypothetical protein